ncbi:hypothetical protein BDW22DRAFT_1416538 [Trametopsis cervina]|nr:hypothetical protein BDW22DRAFT_1416538 [Trametopsis cervina]
MFEPWTPDGKQIQFARSVIDDLICRWEKPRKPSIYFLIQVPVAKATMLSKADGGTTHYHYLPNRSRAHITALMDLPDEIHLAIQTHMTLTALLNARAVCRFWHSLIPGSHIPSPRLRLLELYFRAVRSPAFQATRKQTLEQLQPFDRERALKPLTKGADDEIPEEFRLWILEWPARAAFGGIWPGLRRNLDAEESASCSDESLYKDRGTSLLNASGPSILNQLEVSPHSEMEVSPPWVSVDPAKRVMAFVLDGAYVDGWQRSHMLILSAPSPSKELVGRVYQVDGLRTRADGNFAESWVDYLKRELAREEQWLREHPQQAVSVV